MNAMTLTHPGEPSEQVRSAIADAPGAAAPPVVAPPRPLPPGPGIEVPETAAYRVKRRVLGPPLHTDQLEHERLGKPTALAVFASDALSSTAYATEEVVRVLVPAIGFLAFSAFLLPITLAMVGVLVILMFSYRQTIKAYPSAGGAYIVTKDNLGLLPAQVAGVALLTDYILTVAVSTSAGVAAMYSAFPALYPYRVPVALGFIALIAWGNLRGVKESGRMFAVPTYAFLVSMFAMVGFGAFKAIAGTLGRAPIPTGHIDIHQGPVGAVGLFLVLHAFASGGAAMTGVEAISNGVPAFKKPEWKNARSTLMVMGSCLGVMFIGISFLATRLHTVPSQKATVISQIARATFGSGGAGSVAFYVVQGATMLILVLAANTSFADFPRLASFHAEDAFMPKQLTKRGHRLVFSNGIIFLACAAAVLVVVFGADVTHLIPLYAIGVFTSFTLSQAGMAKRHLRLREPSWRIGILINGGGALATGIVTIVIAATKFRDGAWFIILLVPVMVALLVRLNRQYEAESAELEHEVKAAMTAPVLRRHSVLVLVERLDQSAARAIQYARTLMPDEVRAVHVAVDPDRAEQIGLEWERLDLTSVPLDIVHCPDRRLERAVLDAVADDLAGGRTEVSVLIPRREYKRFWHRLLHDRTADQIAAAVSKLPHANVTFVPYHLGETPISDEALRAYHQAHRDGHTH
ncbi:MAG: nucleic acid binding OB-fold tRNA/helicase-type [Acidimicrobiales bacterium]|nr:nucleic acid binding OB-fold tRNA/helicase-type [Acidimicrobiales bacterium]